MHQESVLAKLHLAPYPRGPHCGKHGAFVDNVPLLRSLHDPDGGVIWAPRNVRALNIDLGSGYCQSVNSDRISDDLAIVAGALNKGNIPAARAALASLRLPAFPVRSDGRLSGLGQSRLAETLRKISLLKTDEPPPEPGDFESKHPRHPEGSPDGVGGQFAPKTSAGEEGASETKTVVRSTVRATAKRLLGVVLKDGWKAPALGEVILEALVEELIDVLTPKELNKGEEEWLRTHVAAHEDFVGGKTLEEINAHPGGDGYQLHHFLENTQENQNLPDGVRDAPENKGNIPTLAHEDIHAELSSTDRKTGAQTLRDSLRGKSVGEQLDEMFKLMKKHGVLK